MWRKFSDTFKKFNDFKCPIAYILSKRLCARCKTDNLSNPYRFYILLMELLFRYRHIRLLRQPRFSITEMQLLLSQMVTRFG